MRKIPSLFVRDMKTHAVTEQVTPGCEWAAAGEGVATLKWDGTCCQVRHVDGKPTLYRRFDAKNGKAPPDGFEPAQEPDEMTGHWPGWIQVRDVPQDKHHFGCHFLCRDSIKRFSEASADEIPEGTYELCGPHFQANPHRFEVDCLIPHGKVTMDGAPRSYEGLRAYFETFDGEGLVFWRTPGDPASELCKIKVKDFRVRDPRPEVVRAILDAAGPDPGPPVGASVVFPAEPFRRLEDSEPQA